MTQKIKPKQLAIKKNTGVRKSKRLAIVKTRKIIKAIAAKLNQNTSSDTESSIDKDTDLEDKSHTETDKEETDGKGGSERYEGDNEEETGENKDENSSHEEENHIFPLLELLPNHNYRPSHNLHCNRTNLLQNLHHCTLNNLYRHFLSTVLLPL